MASVRIDSGPITADLRLQQVPRDKWFTLMQVRRSFLAVHLPYDCRCLLEFVEDAEVMAPSLGFASAQDFIARGLELDPRDVAWAIDGLRRLKPDEPIKFQKAIALGKQGRTEDAPRDEKGRYLKSKGDNITVGRGTTGRAYILARLERDGYAELAEKVRTKAISARAAAKAAGLVRDKTVLEQLLHWWAKASEDERARFMTAIHPQEPR